MSLLRDVSTLQDVAFIQTYNVFLLRSVKFIGIFNNQFNPITVFNFQGLNARLFWY